ncbi:homoserine kinase [Psychrosphaera aquimarina]|uniref:Homoserine kinase n=1 Tax=Psychrosphaera aquimarina TaxID=2044854 RepID=A0ABU3R0C5_9GAMM|nr:homoserine kinase [Psychrosphaera aquimarina]MDU0113118.1 homoserine kinase [Psychrosphaera aquimarina]
MNAVNKNELIGRKASAYAPASTGNVSVGFDLLGAALVRIDQQPLGDTVHVEFSQQDEMINSGEFAHVCPTDKMQNLAWIAYVLFRSKLSNSDEYPAVKMELVKSLPVGSGLGSSACSVVASLTALNRLFELPYTDQALLTLMGEVEAGASGDLHYDNVAPSYFGGLQLMSPHESAPVINLPNPDSWYWVVAFPGFSLPTKEAREVLPKQVDKSVAIYNAQYLSAFVAYLYQGEQTLAAKTIKDVIAEPYRADLIAGFKSSKQHLLEQGALAVGISGAGPTLFALTSDLAQAEKYKNYLEQNYIQQEENQANKGFVHICQCAIQGAKDIELSN